MADKIFVNLPVKDLKVSRAFYTALGYTVNEQFSDETGTCVVISEQIYVMILTHPKFKGFSPHEVADAKMTTQVINCLSCESKEEVVRVAEKALKAGGKKYSEPQDHGFMYQESFQDPDGHAWEYVYMDMSQMPSG